MISDNLPARLNFKSSEGMRDHEEKIRNLDRLIQHNNRRIAAGLRPLAYPDGMLNPILHFWGKGG